MERRYLIFILLSFLVFALNFAYVTWVAPPPPVVHLAKKGDAAAKGAAKAPAKLLVEKQPAKAPKDKGPDAAEKEPGKEKSPDAEKGPGAEKAPADKEKPAEKEEAKEQQPPAVPQQWITLGSADATSPYRMLVTLTNQGAAVARVELNSTRYHDLENRSGYLGHLAPADAPQRAGALVQVVGQGTPAQVAGVMPGDIIKQLDADTVTGAQSFVNALKRTSPKQQITLQILRAGKPISLAVKLRRWPLDVIHPEKKNQIAEFPQPGIDPLSLLLTMQQIDGTELDENETELKGLALRSGNWEVLKANETEADFRMKLPKQQLEIIKHFRLAQVPPNTDDADYPAYHLGLTVEIHNTAEKPRTLAYRLDGPTGLPIEGAWYANKIERSGGVGLRDLVAQFEGSGPDEITTSVIADGKGEWKGSDIPLKYVAVDAQYFAAALIPAKEDAKEPWFARVVPIRVGPIPEDKALKKLTDVTFRLVGRAVEIEPGKPLVERYECFLGPKKPDLLAEYPTKEFSSHSSPGTLSGLVYYGWFDWVAKPMLLVLHFFYLIVRNYGIAIIMLTVLVRGCMFPLSRKQALSAQKMQELQPEIKRLNEKFKKNPEQKTKAQQELFRKHNYNPLGGCLLMFIQLPIFVGLYRSLMVDVELRQAPLFSQAIRWGSNLAAPDMLFDWSNWMPDWINQGTGFFGLGPYFNVLPLLTVGLFLWQQKMFMPPPADDQARIQQKMMQYMMIFMALMFYKVASGLCIYFIASSIWGIAERKILPKTRPQQAGGDQAATSPSAGKAASNGDPSPGKKKQRERK